MDAYGRLRAGQTKADQHFYHIDDHFCPTKSPAARPYLNKPPRAPDTAAVAANRDWVANHLEHVYSKLHEIVPCLDFKEFIAMLTEAARLNVYGYANYRPEHTPYVLVTLQNFLPSTSFKKTRHLKFIFFYDEGISSHDDLWIDKGFSSDLIRVSYMQSVTQRVKKIDIDCRYAQQALTRTLSPAQKKWCLGVL